MDHKSRTPLDYSLSLTTLGCMKKPGWNHVSGVLGIVLIGLLVVNAMQRRQERAVAEECMAALEKSSEQTRKALDAADRCTDTYMQCTKTLKECVATNEACFNFFTAARRSVPSPKGQ